MRVAAFGAHMIGFQPYETFQLLIETGGIERTNTLLCAACDAYARRGKATPQETVTNQPLADYPASPQAADGRFSNPRPRPPDGLAFMARVLWDFTFNKPASTVPATPPSSVSRSRTTAR